MSDSDPPRNPVDIDPNSSLEVAIHRVMMPDQRERCIGRYRGLTGATVDSVSVSRVWPSDWDERRRGERCGMCADAGADEKPGGVRILDGEWCDAYLARWPIRRGYCYVIWKGRHVTEPTELSQEESAGFWREVTSVASAIERHYRPAKMNWLSLGNWVPHLHVHLVPRHTDDPMAGQPLEQEAFDHDGQTPLDDDVLRTEAQALKALIG